MGVIFSVIGTIAGGIVYGAEVVGEAVGKLIIAYPVPCAITVVSLIFLILLYRWCMRCRARNCKCYKRCLRCFGHDKFDDFELNLLVHSVDCSDKKGKVTCYVRVTADKEEVQTSTTSKGIFNEQCTLTVLQGIPVVHVELLDHKERLLASMTLDVLKDILGPKAVVEKNFSLKHVRGMLPNDPKLKLSIILDGTPDEEIGLLSGMSADANIMVRQQIKKAVHDASSSGKSDMEVLRDACAGPLDYFQEMGRCASVHCAVIGPPVQKRYALGLWQDKSEYEARSKPLEVIELLHIKSVQPDPKRTNIFMVNHVEKSKIKKDKSENRKATFRTIDNSRDTWVEMLQLLLKKLHTERER